MSIPQNRIEFKLFGLVKGDVSGCMKWRLEKANHVLLIARLTVLKSRYIEGVSLDYIFEKEIEKRSKFLKNSD